MQARLRPPGQIAASPFVGGLVYAQCVVRAGVGVSGARLTEGGSMDRFWQDDHFGARLFRKSPGFLVMAVLALRLGIGANTAVFSVVHGVLLAPLPYPEPERLVAIYDTQPDCKTCPASFPKYVDWRDQNGVFDVIGRSVPGAPGR